MTALSRDEEALLAPIERAPILAHTLEWAAINSGTGNPEGLAAMAERLADAFALLPGEVRLVEPAPVETVDAAGRLQPVAHGRHLVLSVRPEAERRVILTGHMDTVYPRGHPFQASIWLDDDTLNGPGTADMKGGLAVMLAGLAACERAAPGLRPTLGYDVLINSDEETGSLSSAALIAGLAQGKLAALTYEPGLPDGAMARARPGSGNYAAVVTGRSAHGGRNPQDGRNALVAAGDLALRLAAAVRDGLSVNPARIEGGGPNNVVPDLAVLHFNVRPRSPELAEAARAMIADAAAQVCARHEVHIHVHGHVSRPPKPITPHTEALFALVRGAAADLGQPMRWQDTGGVCDGNNVAACDVPVLDTMGVLGGAIHSPQEFMIASSLDARARLTALVLHRLDRNGLRLPQGATA